MAHLLTFFLQKTNILKGTWSIQCVFGFFKFFAMLLLCFFSKLNLINHETFIVEYKISSNRFVLISSRDIRACRRRGRSIIIILLYLFGWYHLFIYLIGLASKPKSLMFSPLRPPFLLAANVLLVFIKCRDSKN